jgi:4-alpha-glucanotransferase
MKLFNRSGGILLHPTSLPGPYGIGDLGPEAYRFVDWLASTGCKLWQVLPLGPPDIAPVINVSACRNPLYQLDASSKMDCFQDDFADMPDFNASRVDFGLLIPWKLDLLLKAFSRFSSVSEELRKEFNVFCAENTSWLDDYSLFMSLKESNGGGAWSEWDESLRKRKESAMTTARKELAESIQRYSFYQFLF